MAAPTKKSQKYDRQLRLWGDHGQDALEKAHVCVVNASAVGTEILKNLVLPGVGSFTIVDSNRVKEEDLGNNFFLTHDHLGQSRASAAQQLLSELNPDVQGNFIEENVLSIVDNDPDFFKNFSVVIVTQLPTPSIVKLADLLNRLSVPLLLSRVYGMIGYLRLCLSEHTVVESHPDDAIDDLRLAAPFAELQAYVDSVDLDAMNLHQHSHVPYPVVICKHLQQWQQAHNGALPASYKERKEVKQLVTDGIRQRADGLGPADEQNFAEAIAACNTALLPPEIPSDVKAIIENSKAETSNTQTTPFWVLARALRMFVAEQKVLPLRGAVPDMEADTDSYVKLLNIYKAKADADRAKMTSYVNDILTSIDKPASYVPDSLLKTFCKNVTFIKAQSYRPLREELENPDRDQIDSSLEDPSSLLIFYVMLRAIDYYHGTHGAYPGQFDDSFEEDVPQLSSSLASVVNELKLTATIKDDYIQEFCRYGASEPHAIAAYLGGVASQEVIKLVTQQYVPFNNTLLYNGMTQQTSTFVL